MDRSYGSDCIDRPYGGFIGGTIYDDRRGTRIGVTIGDGGGYRYRNHGCSRYDRRVSYWEVTYEMDGYIGHTRTHYRPGRYIEVHDARYRRHRPRGW